MQRYILNVVFSRVQKHVFDNVMWFIYGNYFKFSIETALLYRNQLKKQMLIVIRVPDSGEVALLELNAV